MSPLFASVVLVLGLLPMTLCSRVLSKLTVSDLRPLWNGTHLIGTDEAKMSVQISLAAIVTLCYLSQATVSSNSFIVREGVTIYTKLISTSSENADVVSSVLKDMLSKYVNLGQRRRCKALQAVYMSKAEVEKEVENKINNLVRREAKQVALRAHAMGTLSSLRRVHLSAGKRMTRFQIPLFVFDKVVYELKALGPFKSKNDILTVEYELTQTSKNRLTKPASQQKPFPYKFNEILDGNVLLEVNEVNGKLRLRCSIVLALLSAILDEPFNVQTLSNGDSLSGPYQEFPSTSGSFILLGDYSLNVYFVLSYASSDANGLGAHHSSTLPDSSAPKTETNSIKTVYDELFSAMVGRYREFNDCSLEIADASHLRELLQELNPEKNIVAEERITGLLSPSVPCFPLTGAAVFTEQVEATYKIEYTLQEKIQHPY